MAPRMDCFVFVVMLMLVAGATAQMDCSMAVDSLQTCSSYVAGPEAAPSQVCCDGINNVNGMSPVCLCQLVARMETFPGVNMTKVNDLPAQCNASVDRSKCPAAATPPIPTSMPPLPTSIPPGLSAPPLSTSIPPGLSAPPMAAAIPPGMSFPPGLSAPPIPDFVPPLPAGTPPLPAGTPPLPGVGLPPMFTPPAPVVEGPAAAVNGAASLSASMALVGAVVGVVAALAM